MTSSINLSEYGASLQKSEEKATFDLPHGEQCVLTLKHHFYQDFWGSGQKGELVLDELCSALIANGVSLLIVRVGQGDLVDDQARTVQAALWKTAEAAGTPLPPPPPVPSRWVSGREDLGRALENGSLSIQWADFHVGPTSETLAGSNRPLTVAARVGRLLDGTRPLAEYLLEVRMMTGRQSYADAQGSDRLTLIEGIHTPRVLASASYQNLSRGASVSKYTAERAPIEFLTAAAMGGYSNEAGRPRIVGGAVRELVALASGEAS